METRQEHTQQHLLELKVLRLQKPYLMAPPITIGEQWERTGNSLEKEFKKDICSVSMIPGIVGSNNLSLPHQEKSEKTTIFLGEQYRVYVALHNVSKEPVTDVVLKVEVITPSHRVLLMQSGPIHCLESKNRIDQILTHDVKDLGIHNLVCAVSYSDSSNEERLLKKIEKFHVAKPLEVRPEFQTVENDILLTVQIQNVMPHAVFLETVSFDAAAGFTANDLNTVIHCNDLNNKQSVFGDDDMFYSRTTRQYLYHISPLMPIYPSGSETKAMNVSVGKMDIVWRTRFGDRGRIQTGQLKASLPLPPELQLSVKHSSGTVELEQPFCLTITLSNTTSQTMRLRYQLEKQPGSGVLWSGITCKTQTELGSRESMDLKLELLPVQPGLHSVGPLVLVDMLANQKKYQFNRVAEVFVKRSSASPPKMKDPIEHVHS